MSDYHLQKLDAKIKELQEELSKAHQTIDNLTNELRDVKQQNYWRSHSTGTPPLSDSE